MQEKKTQKAIITMEIEAASTELLDKIENCFRHIKMLDEIKANIHSLKKIDPVLAVDISVAIGGLISSKESSLVEAINNLVKRTTITDIRITRLGEEKK